MSAHRLHIVLTLGLAIITLSCSDPLNRTHGLAPLPDESANTPLSYLREHYYGDARQIVEDVVFEGYVSANDREGNFYKTFIVQDGTGAVEICAGLYDLYNVYPLGQRVVIYARGLWLGRYNGVLQLGRAAYSWNGWRIEDFGARPLLEKYIHVNEGNKPVVATERRLSELSATDCGFLIETEAVVLKPDGIDSWAGENNTIHTFYNSAGDSIAVYTSPYARFAGDWVPTDAIRLRGILMYGKFPSGANRYALKIIRP